MLVSMWNYFGQVYDAAYHDRCRQHSQTIRQYQEQSMQNNLMMARLNQFISTEITDGVFATLNNIISVIEQE